MCKGCDMTREIERLYQEHGLIDGQGPGGINATDPENFAAAINAPLHILSHIAATWPENRERRRALLKDMVADLERLTKERLAMSVGTPVFPPYGSTAQH